MVFGGKINLLGKAVVLGQKNQFCPRQNWEKMVLGRKTNSAQNHFFLGKVDISLQDQIVPSKECVFHFLFVHVTN